VRYDGVVARTVLSLLLVTVSATLSAYSPRLDQRAIDQAVAIGHSYSDAIRDRFHLSYRVHVALAPVDYIDVVTPFRRLVLAAEDRARIGDRFLSQRDAAAVLAAHGEGIELAVELTFHPLNTFVGIPDYDVSVEGPGARVVRARELQRVPRFTPRVTGAPVPGAGPGAGAGSQPLLGGTILARFDRTDLDPQGAFDVVIREARKEVARGRTDLAELR
jgi:hypothetical protein